MNMPNIPYDRSPDAELSTLEKAKVHRESGHPLMALAHVRNDMDRILGATGAHARLHDTRKVATALAKNRPMEQALRNCLTYVSLLREESLCQFALGYPLRAMHCSLIALGFLMEAIAVNQSLVSTLCPKIKELSDQVMSL
jgi:hypothetical protein